MGYINNYGQSLGPIKINNTWLLSYTCPALPEASRVERNYFAITNNKLNPSDYLSPVLAATPILGTYEDNNGIYQLCAPRNAVATVEWVAAYAALKPGEMAGVDINIFATKDDVKILQHQLDTMDKRVVDQAKEINTNKANIAINKTNIELLDTRLTANERETHKNTNDINSMLNDPFPDGIWLICGEVNS